MKTAIEKPSVVRLLDRAIWNPLGCARALGRVFSGDIMRSPFGDKPARQAVHYSEGTLNFWVKF